ncbi:MAG: hypothetical protein Q8M02_00190 [Candidatus Didemnitutus sp.]|nr:hypothetical protein [Candidatus Didemnitutus sp.]
MTEHIFPPDYARIKMVQSFAELLATPFTDGVNALCWARTLTGDFAEIVTAVGESEGIANLDEETLQSLTLSEVGKAARDVVLADLRLLRAHGLAPAVDCIANYPRDDDPAGVATDVYSFHADSAPVAAETYLCTYSGACSEGLRNEQAVRRIDVPETRAQLLALYGGEEGGAFDVFLREHCYDLHYAPVAGARPYSFGVGHLWRIAIAHPDCPVPPCIHRAQAEARCPCCPRCGCGT